MTFPLKLHGHTFDDAPSFAEAVLSDAIAGGGRIKADTLPRTWLGVLATPSDDQRPLLVSLTAWLTRCDNAAESARPSPLRNLCASQLYRFAAALMDWAWVCFCDPIQ